MSGIVLLNKLQGIRMNTITNGSVGERLLTNAEAADFLRVKPETLANWRSVGRGPRHARLGGRVVYPLAQLRQFVTENLCGGKAA
jgi:hypothetical protein